MRRISELDGIRGVAALSILTYHLKPNFLPFGWAAVDVFFVLSGYLITSILLRNVDTDGFFTTFYARRGLRILAGVLPHDPGRRGQLTPLLDQFPLTFPSCSHSRKIFIIIHLNKFPLFRQSSSISGRWRWRSSIT